MKFDESTMSQEEKLSFLEQLFIPQSEDKQEKKRLNFSSFLKTQVFKQRKQKIISREKLSYSSQITNTKYCLFTLIALYIIFIGFLNRSIIFSITPFIFIMYLINLFLFKRKTSEEKYKELISLKTNELKINKNKTNDNINESDIEQCLLLNI